MSGLHINESKSSIFMGGMDVAARGRLCAVWQLAEGRFPVRYLGVPLHPTRLRVADYDVLISKLVGRIQAWNAKSLSYAGRL